MTLGPALKTGGVVGVIMIVVCFYIWFLLSKLSVKFPCNKIDTDKLCSDCNFGVHGGYECHVALAQIGVG